MNRVSVIKVVLGICYTVSVSVSMAFEPGELGPEETQKKELEALQGKWFLTKCETHDKNLKSYLMPGTFSGTLVISGNRGRSKSDFQGDKLEYGFRLAIDPSKNPKHWDENVHIGLHVDWFGDAELDKKGGVVKSIYVVDGDTLTICTNGGYGLPRPRSFDKGQLYVWSRNKNKKNDDVIGSNKTPGESRRGPKVPEGDDNRQPRDDDKGGQSPADKQQSERARRAKVETRVSRGEPLTHFHFDDDTVKPQNSKVRHHLRNTEFRESALYLNGNYEHDATVDGYCAKFQTLDLDYARFTVAMRFKAEGFGPNKTNLLTGGTDGRWFGIHRSTDGNITITLNNQEFVHEVKNAQIPGGKWTVIACGIDLAERKILVYLNGEKAASIDIPKELEQRARTDYPNPGETDKVWSFTNYSNGNVFFGLVDELIIYGKLLSEEEFDKIPLHP